MEEVGAHTSLLTIIEFIFTSFPYGEASALLRVLKTDAMLLADKLASSSGGAHEFSLAGLSRRALRDELHSTRRHCDRCYDSCWQHVRRWQGYLGTTIRSGTAASKCMHSNVLLLSMQAHSAPPKAVLCFAENQSCMRNDDFYALSCASLLLVKIIPYPVTEVVLCSLLVPSRLRLLQPDCHGALLHLWPVCRPHLHPGRRGGPPRGQALALGRPVSDPGLRLRERVGHPEVSSTLCAYFRGILGIFFGSKVWTLSGARAGRRR